MKILYTAQHGPKPEAEKELHAKFVPKEDLLRQADFVCLHCKLTPDTRHIIARRELEMMKPTAYLINTGRGRWSTKRRWRMRWSSTRLPGAGLDVFEQEPIVTPKLLTLPNVVMTPHLGASSRENRMQMAQIAAECTRSALDGKDPQYHA